MQVPHLNINLPKGKLDTSQLTEVFDFVRPTWSMDDIKLEDISGRGFLNTNLICYVEDKTDAIYIRVINPVMINLYNKQLHLTRKFVSQTYLSARLLCTFANGFVEECLQGEPMTWETRTERFEDGNLRQMIADEVGRWHQKQILHEATKANVSKDTFLFKKEWLDGLFEDVRSSNKADKKFLQQFPGVEEILDEIRQITSVLESLGAEKALCHWDLSPGNMILREDGRMMFVDYETLGISFAAADVALFFLIANFSLGTNPISNYPTKEYQHEFCREYLSAKKKYNGDKLGKISDQELREFEMHVEYGKLLALLWLAIRVYSFATNHLTVDIPIDLTKVELSLVWADYSAEKANVCMAALDCMNFWACQLKLGAEEETTEDGEVKSNVHHTVGIR